MSLDFRIRGSVFEQETHRPLPNLIVRAYDKDLLADDLLGDATTDAAAQFEILYTRSDFQDLFERKPDLYFTVYDPFTRRAIHTTARDVRWNAGTDEYFDIPIPRYKLRPTEEDTQLVDAQGESRTEFEPGESLLVHLRRLRPGRSYTVRLVDAAGQEVLSASLLADRYGVIAPTALWPDLGIGDPQAGGPYAFESFEEAQRGLAGRRFELQVLDLDDGTLVRSAPVHLAEGSERPRLYPVAADGRLRRGLLAGSDAVRFRGDNLRAGAFYDLYLVPRQYDWRTGDRIVPVRNLDGSEVVRRVRVPEGETGFSVTLWPADLVRPGRYDVIARRVIEDELRAEERVLRPNDLVSERLLTTLVVRDDLLRVKPILMGCINPLEIAGRRLSGAPYFQFTNNFPKGTDIWAALDPYALPVELVGRKIRYYVVAHKDPVQWSADPGLTNVTGNVSEIVTTSSCVNGNECLVWSDPQQPGAYDLVVDFGNNAADPTLFVTDGEFNPPLDMVDGYLKVGFYVTEDPAVAGPFAVGRTSYNDPAVTLPATGVWAPWGTWGDTPSGTLSLPMQADVAYPATMAGTDVPVSAAQASYPLFVIMHGQHTTADPSYQGYDYLLDHLASHGFIAVSIDCNAINTINGTQDTRAHAILEHLSLLAAKNAAPGLFQGKMDLTRIAIAGHSRGGDGAVQAEVLNQTMGLGHAIGAVIALAPTDFSGISPSPLVLSSSKLLCVYGSNDGDVWGGTGPATDYTGTGFRFYDRATVEKAMVFVYGATHNRFNEEWGTEGKVDTASPKVLSTGQHEMLLKGYVHAFLEAHLLGRSEQLAYFTGEVKLPQAAGIEVYTQYQAAQPDILDHFESGLQIDQNSQGGAVTYANLDGAPQEDSAAALDVHAPHQTRGLRLQWNAATATYKSEIPLIGDRDVSKYGYLSFRVSQVVGSAANPADQAQDLFVRLNSAGDGPSRAVRAGYFGTIPFPYKPEYKSGWDPDEGPNTKAALATVRIPLHAWTIKALSAPVVDLENVESLAFELHARPTGEILVDDIQFTS